MGRFFKRNFDLGAHGRPPQAEVYFPKSGDRLTLRLRRSSGVRPAVVWFEIQVRIVVHRPLTAPIPTSGNLSHARIGVFVPGDGLGDGMMRIPLLHAISKRWPGHRIWWVSAGATSIAGALNHYAAPYLEHIHIGFNVESRLSDMLRQRTQIPSFDIVFNFYTRMASVLMCLRASLPRVIELTVSTGWVRMSSPPR